MRSILDYIMRGRARVVAATVVLGFLAFVLPGLAAAIPVLVVLLPFPGYLSGALLGLVVLRNGPGEGLVVVALASALFGAACLMLFQTLLPMALLLVTFWGPPMLLCVVLRLTTSQGLALLAAGLLAVVAVVLFHLAVGDTAAWWRSFFDETVVRWLGGSAPSVQMDKVAPLMQRLDLVAPVMAGIIATGFMFSSFLMTLIARWGHAVLDNPGGFGKEFRELRLDRRVAFAAMVVIGVALFAEDFGGGLGRDVFLVMTAMFLFQGLAVVHSIVASLGVSIGWLVALYALLFITPQPILNLLSLTGFADAWMGIRERVARNAANS